MIKAKKLADQIGRGVQGEEETNFFKKRCLFLLGQRPPETEVPAASL